MNKDVTLKDINNFIDQLNKERQNERKSKVV